MKAVIGTKTGKSYLIDITEEKKSALIGKKIGDKISGDFLGLKNYILEIRGGSDNSGFPMHPKYEGMVKIRPLLTYGIGMREKKKGLRRRKTVRGNTISEEIAQVNLKVVQEGEKSIEELLGKGRNEASE
jgi:small subunit ribosomal protein S6e